jgi:hypothetical protein
MFNEIDHQYWQFKNLELAWLPSDTEELYLKNVESNYSQLVLNGWVDRQFTYKFNSHGFRSDEFSLDDSIMFFGCSHTCGIGLPLTSTWTFNVARALKLKCFNLGIGGTGPDTAFRLANHYIHQIKPKIVVYLEPPPGRMSIKSTGGKIHNFWARITPEAYDDIGFKHYYEHWLAHEENVLLDSTKHKLAIEMLCYKHNIKFIYADSEVIHVIDFARDLRHAGEKSNRNFADIILDRISTNN